MANQVVVNNLIDDLMAACKTQAEWMKNYTYKWQGHPTIEKSKRYGTCVTYVACVLQRMGILKSGQFIWINNNSKVNGTNSKMTVTYPSGTLKSNKNKFQAGDIIIGGNGNVNAAGGSHIFILTGKWDGNNPYIYDQASANRVREGKKPQHTWNGSFKMIALIRLKEAAASPSSSTISPSTIVVNNPIDDLMAACKTQAEWMKDFKYEWQSNPTIEKSKKKGTCVTYVACVLQRIGVLNSGQYIWHTGSGFGNGVVIHVPTDKMTLTYMNNESFKALKNQLQRGDVVLIDDNRSGNKGGGGHILIFDGTWSNEGKPYVWDQQSAANVKKGNSPRHTYNENRKILAIVRLKVGTKVGVDTGQGIVMKEAIAKLYSSSNYEYVYANQEEEQQETIATKFTQSIQNFLDDFDFNAVPETTTNAIPEPVINPKLIEVNFEHDKFKKILTGKASNLLSYPTWVEAPTIVLDFNGIKIGGYSNRGDTYPNYITSMSVKKINGRINQYTLNLTYQIRPGEDPNFIDKLISRTGYTNPLKILYGDSNYPNAYYKEESAVIMDAKHTEDVSSCRINYTIIAISSIGVAQTSFTTFKERTDRPSNVIYDLLYNSGEISKNLIELFPGMRNRTLVASKGLIPTNDKIVNIGGMTNSSPLAYLTYLVACMNNNENNSTYYLSLVDNSYSEFNGAYFKINEVVSYNNQQTSDINISSNYFVLDIGYPTENYITNFQLCNNNYWSLVYDYAGSIPKFEYGIDDNGDLIQRKTNILYSDNKYNEASLINSTWWKQVTEFPISAKVTIKGLISSALLMTYIKINTLFYGQKDLASGLYVVTSQEDTISGSGYSTELTLLRVAGEV